MFKSLFRIFLLSAMNCAILCAGFYFILQTHSKMANSYGSAYAQLYFQCVQLITECQENCKK